MKKLKNKHNENGSSSVAVSNKTTSHFANNGVAIESFQANSKVNGNDMAPPPPPAVHSIYSRTDFQIPGGFKIFESSQVLNSNGNGNYNDIPGMTTTTAIQPPPANIIIKQEMISMSSSSPSPLPSTSAHILQNYPQATISMSDKEEQGATAKIGKSDKAKVRGPKTFNCLACNKWFTSRAHLNRHYKTTLHKVIEFQF